MTRTVNGTQALATFIEQLHANIKGSMNGFSCGDFGLVGRKSHNSLMKHMNSVGLGFLMPRDWTIP